LNAEAYDFIGGHVAEGVFAYFQAEMVKDLAAVATRKAAEAELSAIKRALAAGESKENIGKQFDEAWRKCPYLAEEALAWHRSKYAAVKTK
jgi:hypothetical protein